MSTRIGRRQFIKGVGLSAMGLALLPRVAHAQKRGGLKPLGSPQHVVILGGGLAGLSAALELKRAGHKITILEARSYAGGRVRTIRDFGGGQYAEAGALNFPPEHTFTYGYATDFGLPLRPIFTLFDSIADISGHTFRISQTQPGTIPLALKPSEQQAGINGLTRLYLDRYLREVGDPRTRGWPPDDLKTIDALSLQQLLINLGASDAAIAIIAASQLGVLGFGLDSISAMDGVVTEAIASAPLFYEIEGGNDQLAAALKKKVKKFFKKLSLVTAIDQTQQDSVTVSFTDSNGPQSITADRVICALPFPVLKDIPVSPAFPDDKQNCIAQLKLTPITRTYQQFSQRTWEQNQLSGYGITDLTIQNTYSPTMTQIGQQGILTSYAGGQNALDLGAMSESDRQNLVLRGFGGLFGNLRNQYQMGLSQIWQDDPLARGAFTYFQPGQMSTLLPIAQRPEGRIHFAGEHTSAWHGWMNGALESGNRTADEVNSAGAAQAIRISARG